MVRDEHDIRGASTDCVTAGLATFNPSECCSENGERNAFTGLYTCQAGVLICEAREDCFNARCSGFLCPDLYIAAVGEGCLVQT
jgi:hypothetical protein